MLLSSSCVFVPSQDHSLFAIVLCGSRESSSALDECEQIGIEFVLVRVGEAV